MSEPTGEKLLRSLAQMVTKTEGAQSLNRFAKLMVIGEMQEKGFTDARNQNSEEVFERDHLCCGSINVLVRFSFLNPAKKFVWDFGSGNVVGKSVGESFISSKGRHSKWLGDGAEKRWEEDNIAGVVLVGLDSYDKVRMYYLSRKEFLSIGKDKLIKNPDEISQWEKDWNELVHEHNFSSFLGAKDVCAE